MWYKIIMSNKEEISVNEDVFNGIAESDDTIVKFLMEDGTMKVINRNFMVSIGADKERNDREQREAERIAEAVRIQKEILADSSKK